MSQRLAAVDCGTNSLRLLIVEYVDGEIREILRTMEIVRLGQGVDATGELNLEAIARTEDTLATYVEMMRTHQVTAVRMVATSATRDVKNRDEFFAMTARLLGQIVPGARAEVITGEEEAQLSFTGAVSDLDPADGPFCVIDLGGGSTEFVVGTKEGEILGTHSAQMGCVRLSERILRQDPPSPTELEIAREFVAERMRQVALLVPLDKAATFVGCAGTFTTLAALALGLEEYSPTAIHNSHLRFDAFRVLINEQIALSAAQRRANPVVHPGRADVLAGGCVVVEGIMDTVPGEEFVISEKDILDGIIHSIIARLP